MRTIVSPTGDNTNEIFSVRARADTASQNYRQNQVFSLSRDRRARLHHAPIHSNSASKIFARVNEFRCVARSKIFFTGTACRTVAND
jgi:hypothetical protein